MFLPTSCLGEQVLAAFIDGNLTDEQRAEVILHLSNCHSCRNLVKEVLQSDHIIHPVTPDTRSKPPES